VQLVGGRKEGRMAEKRMMNILGTFVYEGEND